ncbi:MAG: helix-turn-helix domain-containing protein [Prevotella sp.]|jgi:hypothetical protein|nr:helix-turn-helix domain-containing protein [Prevotella sp.]
MENDNIILISQPVFEEMLSRLETLARRVDYLHEKYKRKKLEDRLNGEQVCSILNIKPRTLQTYRDTGKISFTQIDRKISYRVSDVNRFLRENTNKL